jgi:hypothetical protein
MFGWPKGEISHVNKKCIRDYEIADFLAYKTHFGRLDIKIRTGYFPAISVLVYLYDNMQKFSKNRKINTLLFTSFKIKSGNWKAKTILPG